MPRLSVVVPTYQRRESLARLLRGLERQTLVSDAFEAIVVIDGSTDGTREWLDGYTAPFALSSICQANRGRAAACNAGIRLARGDVLLLLDDDMEPLPDCLAGHLAAHAARPRLGVVGAAPIPRERARPRAAAYMSAKFNQHLQRLAQPGHVFKLRDFYSGNFSIARELLLAVGGFDEDFAMYGNEDLELCLRLWSAGVTLTFSGEAAAIQWYEKDLAALAADTLAKGQTSVLLSRKHPRVLEQLRLATYASAPRHRRLTRAAVVWLTCRLPVLPQLVTSACGLLERAPLPIPVVCYEVVLDYLYWVGVSQALGRPLSGAALADLARAFGDGSA